MLLLTIYFSTGDVCYFEPSADKYSLIPIPLRLECSDDWQFIGALLIRETNDETLVLFVRQLGY